MARPPVTSAPSAPMTRSRSRRTKKEPLNSRHSSDNKSRSSCLSSEVPSDHDIGGRSRSPIESSGSHNNAECSSLDRSCSTITNHSTSANCVPFSVNTSAINCTSSSTEASMPTQESSLKSVENNCKKEENMHLGICIRNLPVLSTDASLRDELFHKYSRFGKVRMVKVISQGTERYAVVSFKRTEEAQKALKISKDKVLYGCKLEVTAHEGLVPVDNKSRPIKIEMDEFHPNATKTLFIGNLEKDITTSELKKHFDPFGEIIEIDIKKSFTNSYAFIQYSDITSVVKAIERLNKKQLGANRIKLAFGKSIPTNCIWIDGVFKGITSKFVAWHFNRFGYVVYAAVDDEKSHALVFYETVDIAELAVSKSRGRIFFGKKLQVDFASQECQVVFFKNLEDTGQMDSDGRILER